MTKHPIQIGSPEYAKVHTTLTHEFTGDSMAADICMSKYLHHDKDNLYEHSLSDIHERWVDEFDRIESQFEAQTGKRVLSKERLAYLLEPFKRFVLGGSPMAGIGLGGYTSMSNCYVIGNDADSYGGIFKTDEEQVQLMKRRGGVGHDLSHIRPEGVEVHNSAITTSGVASFMERFSTSTKEVAQNGRRGALMLSLSIEHPDADKFIDAKKDLTKITGANISIKLTDAFMRAVLAEQQFEHVWRGSDGQELHKTSDAKALFDKIVDNVWASAEPGVFFWDRIMEESNSKAYGKMYEERSTNPCFTGDTKVLVADGSGLKTFKELADSGEDIPVYCLDANGKLVVRTMRRPRLTAHNAQIIQIVLDDGHVINCTANHEFRLANGDFKYAIDLATNDSLWAIDMPSVDKLSIALKTDELVKTERNTVIKQCECCGKEFEVSYDNREQSYCCEACAALGDCSKYADIDTTGDIIVKVVATRHMNKADVYNGTVEDFHNFFIAVNDKQVVNTMNCGEQPLAAYASCILSHRNLTAYVLNPWTADASFDFETFYKDTYDCAVIMDDLVQLEIEAVQRIIAKVQSDKEDFDIKKTELDLWHKVYDKLTNTRRYGMGFLALGDAMAMLGLRYGSQESIDFAVTMQQLLVKATYEASIDLAKIRGSFAIFDYDTDVQSKFIQRMLSELIDDEHIKTYQQFGRRNINTTTIAPTGTTALMTQTTSGIEPVFMPLHKRRRKPTAVDNEADINFIDETTGDKFIEYAVVHYPLMQWICKRVQLGDGKFTLVKDTDIEWSEAEMSRIKAWLSNAPQAVIDELLVQSPYYNATTEDVDWIGKVKLQGALQKYIDSSISVTVNIPNSATKELVREIYLTAWKSGCKGCTIYRDGSRAGVLVKDDKQSKDKSHILQSGHRSKRKPVLPAAVYCVSVYKRKWCILVGCDDGRPYEIFAFELDKDEFDKLQGIEQTTITKTDKKHYKLGDNLSFLQHYDNISERLGSDEQQTITRLYSTMLRNGIDLGEIVDQTAKSFASVGTFCKAIGRALKLHIQDGSKMYAKCPECGGDMVKFDGCVRCTNCGHSACN